MNDAATLSSRTSLNARTLHDGIRFSFANERPRDSSKRKQIPGLLESYQEGLYLSVGRGARYVRYVHMQQRAIGAGGARATATVKRRMSYGSGASRATQRPADTDTYRRMPTVSELWTLDGVVTVGVAAVWLEVSPQSFEP
jgi:hypothetical protein